MGFSAMYIWLWTKPIANCVQSKPLKIKSMIRDALNYKFLKS